MLDLRRIREDPQPARDSLARRGVDPAILDEALELDERRRALLPELEELRARKNQASKRIGQLQRSGENASDAIAEVKGVSAREKELDDELRAVEERRTAVIHSLPNLADPTAAAEDEVIREVGESGRTGRSHVELLGDWLDTERAARVSGSRFVYLKGPLVRLELALVQWAIAKLEPQGFTPVVPPVLVREHALIGTGMLPDTEQQIYRVPDDELYLVGTSEVPLASLHAGEIIAGEDLPRRYAGFSPCFRRTLRSKHTRMRRCCCSPRRSPWAPACCSACSPRGTARVRTSWGRSKGRRDNPAVADPRRCSAPRSRRPRSPFRWRCWSAPGSSPEA